MELLTITLTGYPSKSTGLKLVAEALSHENSTVRRDRSAGIASCWLLLRRRVARLFSMARRELE